MFRTASANGDYRDSAPGDAHQTIVFVDNLDCPDMGGSAEMYWSRSSADNPISFRPDVICVDLESHSSELFLIHIHDRADGSERFGESDGSSAVEESVRLPRAIVNGHRAYNARGGELKDLDADHFGESARGDGANRFLGVFRESHVREVAAGASRALLCPVATAPWERSLTKNLR